MTLVVDEVGVVVAVMETVVAVDVVAAVAV